MKATNSLWQLVGGLFRSNPAEQRSERPQGLAPSPDTAPRANLGQISGRLRHHRIYTYGADLRGVSFTKCRICLDPRQHVFSDAIDEAGATHRCCLRCLRRLGGEEQVQLAAKRSKYGKRVLECIDALDKLRKDFPDADRRPYGEKALLAEIQNPLFGYEGIERVLVKLQSSNWTAYDRARIEGRPQPNNAARAE